MRLFLNSVQALDSISKICDSCNRFAYKKARFSYRAKIVCLFISQEDRYLSIICSYKRYSTIK